MIERPETRAVIHRLNLERIAQAMRAIDPVFLNSPQYRAEALDPLLGCRLVVKVETVNPIRSFKGRGAWWCLSGLSPATTLVCASAGNFGQALAYACRAKGIRLIAGLSANALKVERMRALGAEVRLHGNDFDAAKLEAKRFARQADLRLIEDGLDPATGEGAGTIGIELLRWQERFDAVVIPLGNGALLTGVGRWIKAHSSGTHVIGVAAAGAPAMVESWRAGQQLVATVLCGGNLTPAQMESWLK